MGNGASRSRATRILVASAAAVVVVAGLRAAAGIVGPLMLALALTIVFHPLRRRLERRIPGWGASIVLLLCVYLLLGALVLSLVVSLGRLATLVAGYGSEADGLVTDLADRLQASGLTAAQAETATAPLDPTRIVDLTTSVLSGSLAILSDLLFLVTLLLFLAFDAAQASRLSERTGRSRPELVASLRSFAGGTRTYLGVSAVFGLIVAVIDSAALWAMGVPGAFVWGVLAFVTNFIPNIGFVIGLVPPALIGLLEGGPRMALGVVLLYCLINVIIQSIIQPRYVGNAVGLSTSLTFVSLVFWTWVLGPLGALLAVPMSLLCKAVLVEADPQARWLEPLISGDPSSSEGDGPPRA